MPRKDRRFTCDDLARLRPIAVCDETQMRNLLVWFLEFLANYTPFMTPVIQYALQFLAYAVEHSDKTADDAMREFFELMN